MGLDVEAFNSCLASDTHLANIDRDMQDAAKAQITGTPTFVVGKRAGDSVDGRRVIGPKKYEDFEAVIKRVLGEKVAGS